MFVGDAEVRSCHLPVTPWLSQAICYLSQAPAAGGG